MTPQLSFTAVDTATGKEVEITQDFLDGLTEFEIDYLDAEFDDNFDAFNAELKNPYGFPSYVENSTEEIEKAFDSFAKIGGDVWERATELAGSVEDLAVMGEASTELSSDNLFNLYLEYVEHQNYAPEVSTFLESYHGTFDTRTDFAYSMIHSGVVSADEIIQRHGTIEDWAENGDLRFDYDFIDVGNEIAVFHII